MATQFEQIKAEEEALLCRSYSRYPLALVRGEGARVWDADGKEYIDLLAGIAVTALGHANEEIACVMEKQARTLLHVSNLFYQRAQLALAKQLLETAHFDKAFFCNSGAEANEAAIKLARRYMRKVKSREAFDIITLEGCFHGRTYGALAATGRANLQEGFQPFPEGFSQVPASNIGALEAAITSQTAAVLLEVVQGEGGIVPLPVTYVQQVEALCRTKGILFIVDEVQAGLCRTGKFWAFQHYGVQPDILTTAKALANGLPMGAMLTTDEVSQGFEAGSHATTFGGGELVAAVAARVIEIMRRDRLDERAAASGAYLKERLARLQEEVPNAIREVRGLGLMLGIELAVDAPAVWKELLARGVICNLSHNVTLRLLPPLTIEKTDLDRFVDILGDILKKTSVK